MFLLWRNMPPNILESVLSFWFQIRWEKKSVSSCMSPYRNILESVLNSILVSSRINHECFILYIHHRLTAKGGLHGNHHHCVSRTQRARYTREILSCAPTPYQGIKSASTGLHRYKFQASCQQYTTSHQCPSGPQRFTVVPSREGTSIIFVYFDCLIWYDSKKLSPKLSSRTKFPASILTIYPSARSQSQSVLYRIQLASILCPQAAQYCWCHLCCLLASMVPQLYW